MTISTGVDIVDIKRMKTAISKWRGRFLSKLFTAKELSQGRNRGFPTQHFSGKFAAKEAVFKALSEFRNGEVLQWCDIEVLNHSDGCPKVYLHGEAKEIQKKIGFSQVKVSISHNKEWAVANAVIVSENGKGKMRNKK